MRYGVETTKLGVHGGFECLECKHPWGGCTEQRVEMSCSDFFGDDGNDGDSFLSTLRKRSDLNKKKTKSVIFIVFFIF